MLMQNSKRQKLNFPPFRLKIRQDRITFKTRPVWKRFDMNNNSITYIHAYGTIHCAHVIIQYIIVIYVFL